MHKINSAFFALLAVAGIFARTAAGSACADQGGGTAYYFGNGVANSMLEATVSTQVLSRGIASEGAMGPNDRVRLAYNRTDGLLLDMVEALVQDLQTTFIDGFIAIFEGLDGETADTVVENMARFNADALDDEDVGRHVQQYRSDILSGNKVVLVSHSQGNFFGNRSWTRLTQAEQASFGMVAVANPDNIVAGNSCAEADIQIPGSIGVAACAASLPTPSFLACSPNGNDGVRHTTSCTDVVILGLRFVFGLPDGPSVDVLPRPLPPNTLSAVGDIMSHGFVTTYMNQSSATRSKILGDVIATETNIVQPALRGDLSISGQVRRSDNSGSLPGSRVKVELIADGLFDAIVDDLSDETGRYELCVPSDLIPDNFLLSASRTGFIPTVINVNNDGTGELSIDLQLRPQGEDVVVIEIDPVVHHLGDDRFGGAVNSQFQRLSEGTEYTAVFALTPRQRTATAALITLLAKGLQQPNTLEINGEIVAFLNSSPDDGSFEIVSVPVAVSAFDPDSELQELVITSAQSGADFDDFEFANILITLTLP